MRSSPAPDNTRLSPLVGLSSRSSVVRLVLNSNLLPEVVNSEISRRGIVISAVAFHPMSHKSRVVNSSFAYRARLLMLEVSFHRKWTPLDTARPYGNTSFCRSLPVSDVSEDLRDPTPTRSHTRVGIGDVGFIRKGQFHLLFSASLPLGKGVDVPITFKQLASGLGKRQPPGCLHTSTVRQCGGGPGVMGFTALHVPSL